MVPIVEQCVGCAKAVAVVMKPRALGASEAAEGSPLVCSVGITPTTRWRIGGCPYSTHLVKEAAKTSEKKRVGQQKQKKVTKIGHKK